MGSSSLQRSSTEAPPSEPSPRPPPSPLVHVVLLSLPLPWICVALVAVAIVVRGEVSPGLLRVSSCNTKVGAAAVPRAACEGRGGVSPVFQVIMVTESEALEPEVTELDGKLG